MTDLSSLIVSNGTVVTIAFVVWVVCLCLAGIKFVVRSFLPGVAIAVLLVVSLVAFVAWLALGG